MGSLDTVQQEQLRAIGSYLNQIRQEQARSLEEISAKTYIPLRLLKAIETGQERPLPEPVFIQGFIRRYADALGLDGIDLSQRFPINVTPLPVMAAVAGNREKLKEPANSDRVGPIETENSILSRLPSITNLPYVAVAALLALGGIALAVVWGLSARQPNAPNRSTVVLPKQPSFNQSSPTVTPSSSPKAATSSPSATPKVQATPASPRATVSPTTASPSASSNNRAATTASPSPSGDRNAPVRVELNLSDESWVQVIVDGQVKAEAILPQGTRQSWSGKEEITVLVGNAGAVSIAQNGSSPKKMGALGDVSEMTFKAQQTSN